MQNGRTDDLHDQIDAEIRELLAPLSEDEEKEAHVSHIIDAVHSIEAQSQQRTRQLSTQLAEAETSLTLMRDELDNTR